MYRPHWQKSSFSGSDGSDNCLEAARGPAGSGGLLLRESDRPETVLTTTPARLHALLDAARAHGPGGT
ncbi:hypothetical protein GCM10009716_22050 [Streptomyces sodiiphilus]|uniref:DUF397 domain-containing protein n=1 Tax=Streptomyces sodiiphilus TaxID=226217 RepID=A0ABN2P473_9ACTN